MDGSADKIAELERKIAFMKLCHGEQARYFTRRIVEIEHKLTRLCELVMPELNDIEDLGYDTDLPLGGDEATAPVGGDPAEGLQVATEVDLPAIRAAEEILAGRRSA